MLGGQLTITCKFCIKEFQTYPYRLNGKVNFCSRKCHGLWRQANQIGYNSGFKQKQEIKDLLSKKHKGRHFSLATEFKEGQVRGENSPSWKGGLPMCLECGDKLNSYGAKRCKSCAKRGDRSHLWRGGITPLNRLIRSSTRYKVWRKTVFERDNYTCRICGVRGEKLNADHIKPFAYFPELRFVVDNGRALCENCHLKTDSFAQKAIINYMW